ncbi:BrnT family toxin [bacterium]|nr:BrnT family toxin [bacterium]
MKTITFEWDLKKEDQNIKKHKCSFLEAIQVFYDPRVIHLEDENHSSVENRFYAVGKSEKGNVITVRYTWREDKIRIYGAAKWRKWRKYYEKNS